MIGTFSETDELSIPLRQIIRDVLRDQQASEEQSFANIRSAPDTYGIARIK